MYEHRTKPLISRKAFFRRLVAHGLVGLAIIFVSLVIGVVCYHQLAGMSWVDAILNAAMIMGGMGPVNPLVSDGAKLFAAGYALYSGLVLLLSVGLIFAPVFHRILHRFHLENEK
jgi:hypothetical protein